MPDAPHDSPPAPAEPEAPLPALQLRAHRFRMLAWLWCLVTPGALFLLFAERAWLAAASPVESLRAVRFEQWIALGLLALHGWFAWRAWRLRGDL